MLDGSEQSKHCKACGLSKSFREYYTDPRMRDGMGSSCIDCHNAKRRAKRESDIEICREKDRALYAKNRTRRLAAVTAQSKTKKGREAQAARVTKYRSAHPERRKARLEFSWAVKSGALKKPLACEACKQEGRVQGHHNDYTKPLEVEWLCTTCHGIAHRITSKEFPGEKGANNGGIGK